MMPAPVLGVFVPALMAVGILVSGAVVAAEWVSSLFPSRAVRRQQQNTDAALGVVTRIAQVVEADVSVFDIERREARARRVYVVAAVVFAALGLITVRFGVDMYLDPLGWLHENEWVLGIGYGVGGLLVLVAVISLLPAAVSLQSAPVVRALIRHTWLGRPAAPPRDPHDLIHDHETETT